MSEKQIKRLGRAARKAGLKPTKTDWRRAKKVWHRTGDQAAALAAMETRP